MLTKLLLDRTGQTLIESILCVASQCRSQPEMTHSEGVHTRSDRWPKDTSVGRVGGRSEKGVNHVSV